VPLPPSATAPGVAASAMIVTIDGPAAAGKGTLARRLADHLGLAYLDSGKLYRAVGLKLLRQGLDPADAGAAARIAQTVGIGDLDEPGLDDEAVAQAATIVAAYPKVREALLLVQRDFAANPPENRPGAVIDGRDIGTVVCPDADHKFFVTASLEIRAARRLNELLERGVESIHSRVLRDMKARDDRDSGRQTSPLAPAGDAHLLDTTGLDPDEAFAAALALIER